MPSVPCKINRCWTKPNGEHAGVGCGCPCHIEEEKMKKDRCPHGVWVADYCWQCPRESKETIKQGSDTLYELKARAADADRYEKALKEIDAVTIERVEGGPSDMSQESRDLLAAFGKCASIAKKALQGTGKK